MVIQDYFLGATHIRIHDDYMAKTPKENEIIKANIDDVARRINERIFREGEINECI